MATGLLDQEVQSSRDLSLDSMSIPRLPLLSISVVLVMSSLVPGQTRGGGSGSSRGTGSHVDAATNARNAAVLGKGDDIDFSVHPNSASDEPRVEFRTQTVLVQVPVVVTDKSGKHKHGISKEDFTVFENGKPVNLASVEELTANAGPLTIPAVAPGQFRNLTFEGSQPRNVVVIALDTVNTPFLDQAYGRRELIKFLAKNVDSGHVLALMLITSHGLKVVQGLTGDSTRLM